MTDATSDTREIFRRASTGDSAAFCELVERHEAPLLLFVARHAGYRVGPDCSADDIVQVVLARAWKLLPSIEFRGDRAFYAWLVALARAALQDRAKYLDAKNRGSVRQLDSHSDGTAGGAPEPIAQQTSVSLRLSRREECERLSAALARLPDKYREVVERHVLEARSLSEIAGELGLTKNAVWERLHRAMARLRAILGTKEPSSVP